MSLLNDALRKKRREVEQAKGANLFQSEPSRKTRGRKVFVLIPLILIIGVLCIMGLKQLFMPSNTFLEGRKATDNHITGKVLSAGASFDKPQTAGDIAIGLDSPVNSSEERKTTESTAIEQKKPLLNEAGFQRPLDSKKAEESSLRPVVTFEKKQESKCAEMISEPKKVRVGDDATLIEVSETEPLKPSEGPKKKKLPKIQKKSKKSSVPGSEEPFYTKAVSYHRRNDLKKAIQMYQEVLRKNPEHFDSLFNLSSAYIETFAYLEAHTILEKLYRSEKKNPQILLNLAVAEIGLGRPQNAISYLNEADTLEDKPEFEIFFHKGVAMSKLGMLNESEIWYKKAKKLNPRHPRLIFNMAVVYDKLKKYRECLEYYEAFLKNEGKISVQERKEVERRIRAIKAYMAYQLS